MATQTVWIIDDETDIAETYAALLEGESDVKTACFASAKAALVEIRKGNHPDLFITDIKMPEMSGLEFITELHKLQRTEPVIIISGYAEKEDAIAALALDAFGLIEKPFHKHQFIHTAHRALAYGAMIQLTEDVIRRYSGLITTMKDLVEQCRTRYTTAENQLPTASEGQEDRSMAMVFLKNVMEETKIDDSMQKAQKDIESILLRRDALRALVADTKTAAKTAAKIAEAK